MALIKCPECGRDVSDTIENCIHCGFILKKPEERTEQQEQSQIELQKDCNEIVDSTDNISVTTEQKSSKFDLILCSIVAIVIFFIILVAMAHSCFSIFSCSYCTDDGFNPCENCTDGTVICENCEGNMIVECNNCNEEFKEKCTNCNGSGNGKQYTEKCFTCGGNGALQFECSNCNGKGWVYARLTPTKCMQCNGSGNGEVRDCPVCKNGITTRYEDCESCDGKGYGKDDCTKCNKTKEIECESCLGKGCISCPECDGTQKIPCEYCNANHTNTTTADD